VALSERERAVAAEALRKVADALVYAAAAEINLGPIPTAISPRAVEEVSLAIARQMGILQPNEPAGAKKVRTSRKRKPNKKLSAALKQANSKYRKKDGSLRAGRTQRDIMKYAHKLRRKM
jgi:hypothetical protein